MAQQIGLTCSDELLEEIDKRRGLIPRAAYVRAMLESVLYGELVEPEAKVVKPKLPKPPAKKKETPKVLDAIAEQAGLKPASEIRYGCRVPDCDFTAPSPKAKCNDHPGALVEIS